ncbi:glycosyl transferase group 1 [Niastella koreensis GR20-10]|uniref:Glycosyl transferase group 1 n=1 Tax=Niastella koreensis (strain DSM 17620 / KACC 11465 / NBRC 106392 / GR20-10) TaxID=700598 RepID=G8TBI6_NIAKG|nr:glycosyltransferase family 4 protein [Niastella koreensis]AEV97096.1 glycosyl transferase group 1 [Niastella koreensis GR20-10]
MAMLRIAQIAPLIESVPPKLYGGTERVVAYLTDALVKLGHDVTLFASGDSITKARLVSVTPTALRLSNCVDFMAGSMLQLQEVMDRAHEFDLLHFHTDYLHFPVTRRSHKKTLTTLHGRLDIPELKPLYEKFNDMPVVSISDSQRGPLPMANWIDTVYHGLPDDLYKYGKGEGDYVVFLGRFSPEKRADRAIEIARRANVKIKIAAKVDKADEKYFEKEIRHLLDQPHVEYLQEIGEREKGPLLANARALLFPIDWPEPFGMVLIEAMACGTPIIAFNHGSVAEIVEHGKTGFIVNTMEKAVEALKNIHLINRDTCRETFERRFSNIVMAQNYVRLYEKLLHKQSERSYYLTPAYRK